MTENTNYEGQSGQIDAAPEIAAETVACDLALFSDANEFAVAVLKKIPELHGIAIIPIWQPQLQDVPNGLLRLRNETPPYIAALLQILGKLAAFGADVHRDMNNQFRAFDRMAQDISTEVKNKLEELRAVTEKLNAPEKNAQ